MQLTIQVIAQTLGGVLTYAETEMETLAACGVTADVDDPHVVAEAETAKAAINAGNELYRKLHHLTHDPFDLLARVMAASEAGHIKGLYGPLHGAIKSTLEAAGLPAADAAVVASATPEALPADVPQSSNGELPETGDPSLDTAGAESESWVVFAQSEFDRSGDGAGFWSNELGWGLLEYATTFNSRTDLPVPIAEDAAWITMGQAKVLAQPFASDYRLLIVVGDVEPNLSAEVHETYESVLDEAREYRKHDDQDMSDGLFVIRVPRGAAVDVVSFSGGDFDGGEDDEDDGEG